MLYMHQPSSSVSLDLQIEGDLTLWIKGIYDPGDQSEPNIGPDCCLKGTTQGLLSPRHLGLWNPRQMVWKYGVSSLRRMKNLPL